MEPQTGWYVTVKHAGQTGYLVGPCSSRETADEYVDAARDYMARYDPYCIFYTWGVSHLPTRRPAKFNDDVNFDPDEDA